MSITARLTVFGSPTSPRSITFSMLESGSISVRVTFSANTMLPSLPERPTALPPSALIAITISLLIDWRAPFRHSTACR
jgi:hypothetical protein